MVVPGRPHMTVQCSADKMRFACRVTKARIQTHIVMVFLAYARQQWSRERDLVLRFTYTACWVIKGGNPDKCFWSPFLGAFAEMR